MKKFNFDTDVRWEIVTTAERLQTLCRELQDQKIFCWDVETSCLRVWDGAQIVGHAFAWRRPNKQVKSFYVPIRHKFTRVSMLGDQTQLSVDVVTAALRPILEGNAIKIGHNIKFDIHQAWADQTKVSAPVADTMIAARLVDENMPNYKLAYCLTRFHIPHEHGWKKSLNADLNQAAKDLGYKVTELKKKHGFQYVSIPVLGRYACEDAAFELFLGERLLPEQIKWKNIWDMEMRLIWVCIAMERKGVLINRQQLLDLAAIERQTMSELAPKIWGLAGEEFELSKDNELRRILFQKMRYPEQGKTKKGLLSVDDDSLWKLEKGGVEIARLMRLWNASDKVVSTYTENIVALSDDHGVLHAEFDQAGAKTGRMSSRAPNLQNIPVRTELGRKVREAFYLEKGKIRWCIDYSQAELRVLANLSRDPILLKTYYDDLDAHSMTAISVFGTDKTVNGLNMRSTAKIINFGIPFGMTYIGLMKNINKGLKDDVTPINEDQANKFLDGYYAKYQGVTNFKNKLYALIRKQGMFWNLFGRPRRIKDMDSPVGWRRSSAERKAVSSAVQGSTADLVKFSMVEVHDYLQSQTHTEADLVMMIHDDLQIDSGIDGSAKMVREVHHIMENTCQSKMCISIKADVEYFNTNWANKRSFKGF